MKNLTLLLFIFAVFFTKAQNNTIDSLKLALKNAKHDTMRCKILYELVDIASDEEWPVFNEQLKNVAESNLKNPSISASLTKFFINYLAASYANNGFLALQKGDKARALNYYLKSLAYYQKTNNEKDMATVFNQLGDLSERRGDIASGLMYFQKSLKISEKMGNDLDIARSFNNLASIYSKQDDLNKALEYHKKSLKIRERIKNKAGVAESLNNIATVFYVQKKLPQALEYYIQSLTIQEELSDKRSLAVSLNNISFIFTFQNDFNKAFEYAKRGLKINEEIKDKVGVATSLSNLATIYTKQGKTALALEYFQKCMLICKELGYPSNIQNTAQQLAQMYKAKGDYKNALVNYELFVQMRDSISNQETRKASIRSQFKYEYEKQASLDSLAHAKENLVKNSELQKQKAEIKAKRNQQYALFGGLALVLVFAGFMYNRFKITQKQKSIIELKEQETQQQKHLLEEKHKEITDSIHYAERIQRSFLASRELLDDNLSSTLGRSRGADYFVFFRPKDVVSGDFYWADTLKNGNFALVTADSTGHGVPGAIMSLLNISSIEKAIENHNNPAGILNNARKIIINRLKKDGSVDGGKDGMDCSMIVFDFENKKLQVACANNPVWIVRHHPLSGAEGEGAELIEIKPDKMPVGKHDKDQELFTLHEIDLQHGDVIYTLTDGFSDQFGGEKGEKFMSKNLRELLIANSHLPMHEQQLLLENTFTNWVGHLEQVDDVTLIGIRV